MAAVAAIKAAEIVDPITALGAQAQRAPGITIVLVDADGASAPYKPTIDVTPQEPAGQRAIDDDDN